MGKPTTIPLCLDVLGGMQDSDPAVMVTGGESIWAVHPLAEIADIYDPSDDDRLLVEQSEGALLEVLARHSWDTFEELSEPGERALLLVIVTGKNEKRWKLAVYDKHRRTAFAKWLPAHISTDLDRIGALAEAVVWYARSARCEEATGFPADDRLLERWNDDSSSMWSLLIEAMPLPDVLAAIEESLGLPEWLVTS